jgi:hypothetical protein
MERHTGRSTDDGLRVALWSAWSAETLIKTIAAIICSGIVAGGLVVAAERLNEGPRFVWSPDARVVFDRDAKQICWAGMLAKTPQGFVPCYKGHPFTNVHDELLGDGR